MRRVAAVGVIRAPGPYPVGQFGTKAMSTNTIAETAEQTIPAQSISTYGRMIARLTLILGLAGVMAACQTARFGGQPQQRGKVCAILEYGPLGASAIVMAEPLGAPGSDSHRNDLTPSWSRVKRLGDDDRQQTAARSER